MQESDVAAPVADAASESSAIADPSEKDMGRYVASSPSTIESKRCGAVCVARVVPSCAGGPPLWLCSEAAGDALREYADKRGFDQIAEREIVLTLNAENATRSTLGGDVSPNRVRVAAVVWRAAGLVAGKSKRPLASGAA